MFAEILGKGAFSCVQYDPDRRIIYNIKTGYDINPDDTTNNRVEILGLLSALDLSITKYKHETCLIYCDSAYCVNMFNSWISKWASNNWMRTKTEEVKNIDLVKQLYKYKQLDFPNFEVLKVHGHCGDIGNEIADAAARQIVYNEKEKLAKIIKENDITLELG